MWIILINPTIISHIINYKNINIRNFKSNNKNNYDLIECCKLIITNLIYSPHNIRD